ncbi:MAG: YciI family protein [Solirubrobacteraceae bacterium]
MTTERVEAAQPAAARARYLLIFRGGAVSRDDVSPGMLQAHLEKWYAWADDLARQGRRNAGTPLANGGKAVRGRERIVTDGPYAESKDLVTGAMIIDAVSFDDAVDVARGCPTYEFDGSVEVRPVQDEGS